MNYTEDDLRAAYEPLGDGLDRSLRKHHTLVATLREAAADGRWSRRRRLWIAPLAAAVVLIGGVVLAVTLNANDSPAPPRRASGALLVAYTGKQLPGFTVAKVPAGYVVEGGNAAVLDIARPGDHTPIDAFPSKIVVSLESSRMIGRSGDTPVKVDGKPGVLRHLPDATVLDYTDGVHRIVVQAWSDIGLTDSQLIEFAAGVTVNPTAVRPRG